LQNNSSVRLFIIRMKKLISIPLIILLLFSGISVKFATHYCGGFVAATKVSLDGELATCGMEHPSENNSLQDTYNNKCCDDVTSAYSICSNYYPCSYSVNDPGLQVIYTIDIPVDYLYYQQVTINNAGNNIRPPGDNSPNSVTLPQVCVFRI
jgi:hypothetical protein